MKPTGAFTGLLASLFQPTNLAFFIPVLHHYTASRSLEFCFQYRLMPAAEIERQSCSAASIATTL